MKQITTFLMFAREQHGRAKEAIDSYISLFERSGMITSNITARMGPSRKGRSSGRRFG